MINYLETVSILANIIVKVRYNIALVEIKVLFTAFHSQI